MTLGEIDQNRLEMLKKNKLKIDCISLKEDLLNEIRNQLSKNVKSEDLIKLVENDDSLINFALFHFLMGIIDENAELDIMGINEEIAAIYFDSIM